MSNSELDSIISQVGKNVMEEGLDAKTSLLKTRRHATKNGKSIKADVERGAKRYANLGSVSKNFDF